MPCVGLMIAAVPPLCGILKKKREADKKVLYHGRSLAYIDFHAQSPENCWRGACPRVG